MANPFVTVLVALVCLAVVSYVRYRKAIGMVSDLPGLRLLVSPLSSLGLLLPALPNSLSTYPGFSFPWELKHKGLFARFKSDTISLCAPDGHGILYTCDVPFITRMCSFAARESWPKPVDHYSVLGYLGGNLVIAEGDDWRRQRRVGAPAFSTEMFARLWVDMKNIVEEMVDQEQWVQRTENGAGLLVPHTVDITLRMALAAIARAGFGMDFEWHTNESFTAVCQAFGRPVRWRWWLTVLDTFYAFVDFVFPSSVPSSPAVKRTCAVIADVNSRLLSIPILGTVFLVVIEAIVGYILGELYTAVERPTDEDWNPREIELQEALHLVAKDSTLRLALPEWAMRLPVQRMRRMRLAFTTLESELRRMAVERKEFHLKSSDDADTPLPLNSVALDMTTKRPSLKPSRSDLLHNLVKASLADVGDLEAGGAKGLSDNEIIGNTFIYYLAGHETTAHSLAWNLALLAAYPEQQDRLYQEIVQNWPRSEDDAETPFSGETTIDDYNKFPFALATYWETLRLFPPVQQIPKVAAEDMRVVIEKSNEAPIANNTCEDVPSVGSKFDSPLPFASLERDKRGSRKALVVDPSTQRDFVVKKGTVVFVDPPAVHYNPRYWDNPDQFDPSRFLRPYNKDAFIPFGVGHRACLGRKFSEVESVSMLVHLLRHYEVHLPPTEEDGVTVNVEKAREMFSKASVRITLTPAKVPLIFKRRVPKA